VRAVTGFSAAVAAGGFERPLREANGASIGSSANGAVVRAALGPGLAPVVGGRVGLGDSLEGGIVYTGRGARLDLRSSFGLSTHWAFSAGIGGTAIWTGSEEGPSPAGLDLASLHGWGADVPVLVGYASDADLYMLWVGARCGWQHAGTGDAAVSATIAAAGGVLGIAVGFRHVHVAMELDVAYASTWGEVSAHGTALHVREDGLTLVPAGAVWWRF
jgi:hypothetical protein